MESIPDQFALSLRTWPSGNNASSALRSQIPRIHAQRGSFRNITEEILEKEINAAETDAVAKEEEASSEDEEEEEKPDPVKELTATKEQMFQKIAQAHQTSTFALDFVSLLLSKFNPNSAVTMQPAIRDPGEYNIPIGTIGADIVRDPRHTDAQKHENRRIAKGWKILSLNKSVDSILNAATRLEQEMEAEAKYWEEVLAIKEKGWAISYATPTSQYERLNAKTSDGTLVVRFGFSESAPEFRNRGLAVLRRTDYGGIALGTDILQTNPKRLQVRVEKNGIESGHSVFSLFGDMDSSVQSQVLKARNSIFEQELWHELLRESRNLVAYGVVLQDSSISIPLTSTKTVFLKFTADSDEPSSPFSTQEDGKMANTICIAIHLLLTFSHRSRLRLRSQPPPPISAENHLGNTPTQPCTLLRPVIAHLYHQSSISSLHSLLAPITNILVSAGFSCNYDITQRPSPTAGTQANKYLYLPQSVSEKVIDSLIENIQGEATLTIKDNGGDKKERTFTIQFRTVLFPVATTQYRVLGASETYKAPPTFSSINEVREYILFATTCAIAEFFVKSAQVEESGLASSEQRNEDAAKQRTTAETTSKGWQTTVHSNVIRESVPNTNEVREVSFTFETIDTVATPLKPTFAQPSPEKSLFPSNEADMKLGLKADRKCKSESGIGDAGNGRTAGESIWWVGGGESMGLREIVEAGDLVATVPIRLPVGGNQVSRGG